MASSSRDGGAGTETCEIRWRRRLYGTCVLYARMIGPAGINQSVESREPLELWGWASGRHGEPKYPKLCTTYGYGSDKNDGILTRFISRLVQDGWVFETTVTDKQPLFAILKRRAKEK